MKTSSIILVLLIASSQILCAAFRENVTLHVPSEYATINDALYDLDEKTISKDVSVTVKVADGTYTFSSPIVVMHPSGSQIHIVGNTSNPENVTLNFTSTDGFVVYDGNSIGSINGFKIVGPGTSAIGKKGINCTDNARVALGSSIIISNWYIGLGSTWSSYISSALGITISNCHTGILAFGGGIVYAENATISNNTVGLDLLGNSFIHCARANITNNTTGIKAYLQSGVEAALVTFSGNTTNVTTSGNSFVNH